MSEAQAKIAGSRWGEAMQALRAILSPLPLAEQRKWGWPCYVHEGRNIVLIHAFKDYCALLFFKGALMPDPQRLLVRQSENVQSPRQMRFISLEEVHARRKAIAAYVADAIAVEASGRTVAKAPATPWPEELEERLASDAALRGAFEALTPGRRRAYLLHFGGAKQAKTRRARIDACAPRILAGKGLDD